MLLFNHALAGSIVAVITPVPAAVPVVAFATHYLLDLTPHAHGEEPPFSRFLKIQIGIDLVLTPFAVLFAFVLFPDQWFIVGVGALFGMAPDFLWILWRRPGLPKWFNKFLDWAHYIQWGERPYGWIFDATYGMIMCITLYLLAGQPWG